MKKIYELCIDALLVCLLLGGCGATQEAGETVEVAATVESTDTENTISEEETADAGVAVEESTQESAAEAEKKEEIIPESEEETSAESTEEATEEAVEEIIVTPFETAKTMYATISLNVRKGPSTDYDIVGHLSTAQAVEVNGQADIGWYQIVLDEESVFVSNKYLSETKVEIPAPAPAQPAPAEQAAAPAQPTATVAPAGVIMVGDSRCVQMQAAVGGGGCSWICENSKEYTWFSEKAIPRFDPYVGKGTKVVINMGVNDPEHYQQYAELVNVKAAEWAARGARTYFVSVNPVWENPYTTQEQVDTFNANVPGMLSGVKWIDTSSWLTTNGYRLVDGLHFDDPTSVNIFNLIMGSL